MPIHINLLAEAQAAEELRRRDPVKRSMQFSGVTLGLILLWCVVAQAQIMRANTEFKRNESRWNAISTKHAEVTANLAKSGEIERNLTSLDRLSTNRFLMGSTLDALQQTVVDKVQAVRVKTEQVFTFIEPVPAKTNVSKVTPGKPAAAVEKTAITIEAKDWRPSDQNYNKFKEAIAKYPIFQTNLSKPDSLRLTSLSKPSYDPSDPVAAFVTFTLEMQFPEIRRHE